MTHLPAAEARAAPCAPPPLSPAWHQTLYDRLAGQAAAPAESGAVLIPCVVQAFLQVLAAPGSGLEPGFPEAALAPLGEAGRQHAQQLRARGAAFTCLLRGLQAGRRAYHELVTAARLGPAAEALARQFIERGFDQVELGAGAEWEQPDHPALQRLHQAEQSLIGLREFALLDEIARDVTSTLDLDQVLELILVRVKAALGVEATSVLLVEPATGELVFRAASGGLAAGNLAQVRIPRGQGVAGWVVQTGQTVTIADTAADTRFYAGVDKSAGFNTRSILAVPLKVKEHILGVLEAINKIGDPFTEGDEKRLTLFASWAAIALENARLYTEVNQRAQQLKQEQVRLKMIHEVDQVTLESLDERTLLTIVAQRLQTAFGFSRVSVWLVAGDELRPTVSAGFPQPGSVSGSADFPRRVIAQGQCLWVADLAAEPDAGGRAGSVVAAPLSLKGEVAGVLMAESDKPGAFNAGDLATLQTVAGGIALALKNARLFQQVTRAKSEWELTFDSLAEGVALHDERFRIIRSNFALARMLETSPTALLNQNAADALCGPQTPQGAALAEAAGRKAGTLEVTGGRRGRTFQVALNPVQAGGGVLVVRDVTDERSWQARLMQSEKLASLGQLAAGVAHEINNPLGFIHSNLSTLSRYNEEVGALITGFRQTLAGDPRLAQCEAGHDVDFLLQDMGQAVAESQEGVERVQSIVVSLKNFARSDQSAEMRYADLHKGLESALKIAWNEIKYKATVERDYGELPEVCCNPSRLGQVFINILVNAAQAIEHNGQITLRTRALEDYVAIAIQDNGPGIPRETAAHMFEPFFTTKEIGQGTGLGLSVVYGIVQEHGGQIDVASQVGHGTTFTIYLPIHGPHADSAEAQTP